MTSTFSESNHSARDRRADVGLVLMVGGNDLDRHAERLREVVHRELSGDDRAHALVVGVDARHVIQNADLERPRGLRTERAGASARAAAPPIRTCRRSGLFAVFIPFSLGGAPAWVFGGPIRSTVARRADRGNRNAGGTSLHTDRARTSPKKERSRNPSEILAHHAAPRRQKSSDYGRLTSTPIDGIALERTRERDRRVGQRSRASLAVALFDSERRLQSFRNSATGTAAGGRIADAALLGVVS